MPLDKMDQEQIREGMKIADYPARSARPVARDWAVLSLAVVAVLALISIVVVAIIFAMSERRQLTELSISTQSRLTEIDRELASLGARLGETLAADEAAQPDFHKRVVELLNGCLQRALKNDEPILSIETAAALARKARELKLDASPEQIDTIALGFLRYVEDEAPAPAKQGQPGIVRDRKLSDPAIAAVAELISYRSLLLPGPIGQLHDGTEAHTAMLKLPKLHSFRPLDLTSRIYGSMRSLGSDTQSTGAKIDLINRQENILGEDYRTLVVDGYDLKLDGLDVRNAVFSNCKITYAGGPLALDHVYFTNCTFDIARQGKDFANAALSPSGQVGVARR